RRSLMAVFTYRGRSTAGVVAGELEAETRLAAVNSLRARGVTATLVQERKAKASGQRKFGGSVKDKHLAIYTRQFSTMIDGGLPIAQCLGILSEQSESKPLRTVTSAITKDIEGGVTLADAFRKHPRIFSDLFTNMLEAGESGGVLDVVLQRLSVYIEKSAALK